MTCLKTKQCDTCKRELPVTDFGLGSKRANGKKRRDKYRRCRRRRYEPYSRSLQIKYNIALADYLRMHRQQNHRCAICRRKRKLYVDHDHACCKGQRSCGKCVRGLLCCGCNLFVGRIEKAPALDAALTYIGKM